jgi:hypothetical protein
VTRRGGTGGRGTRKRGRRKASGAPCVDCPFRKDVRGYLRAERVDDIRDGLERGSMFACHKTTGVSGDFSSGFDGKWCRGALLMLENQGGAEQNQMARIGERLGEFNLDDLGDESVVYDSWEDMRDAHGGAT